MMREKGKIGVKDGRCVSVHDVKRGKGCGCVCAACGGSLVARQGEIRTWHFAHADSGACTAMGETHLHLAAKQLLQESLSLVLPDYPGTEYGCRGASGRNYLTKSILWSPVHKDLREQAHKPLIKGREFTADRVETEVPLEGFRADIVFHKGGRRLLVEIRVTHETDETKRRKIKQTGLACVEIDLSRTPRDVNLPDLKHIVTGIGGGAAHKPAPRHWISNPKGAGKADKRFRHHREIFAERIRSAAGTHPVRPSYTNMGPDVVENCPIKEYKGRRQARMSACICCDHHIAYFDADDEGLHTALTGRKADSVVYCGCTSQMARAYWQARREQEKQERNLQKTVKECLVRPSLPERGYDVPPEITGDPKRFDIWEVQERLKQAGYCPGPADGVMGPRTKAALKGFQASEGFAPHGEIDRTTLAILPALRKARN
ncbi:MAG: peptidoglycan-binding protein [Rhodobacteraceae bacterium]|nr:peptidoglycan-binding protein [Paracoccaceae bacterium]